MAEGFLEVDAAELRWQNYFEDVFQLLVGHVAVFGRVQLLQKELVILHEVEATIDSQILVSQLLESTDVSRLHINGLLQLAIADHISQLLEVREFHGTYLLESLSEGVIIVLDGSMIVNELITSSIYAIGVILLGIRIHHFTGGCQL